MNLPLRPLPLELLSTWSSWRPNVTPSSLKAPFRYHSGTHYDESQADSDIVLPPVHRSPLTRREPRSSISTSTGLPAAIVPSAPPNATLPDICDFRHVSSLSRQSPLDWFSNAQQRPSRHIVEKTCEMICYLWFSSQSSSISPPKRTRADPEGPQTYFPHSDSSTASLQFSVSPAFICFMQKVLETTQVSQSVIVLSLHYIYRMKARNRFTSGQPGSEYRVAMAALMMANKFVDDNTYTNKTWSEVSGIDLVELNKMEREFLLGIDFGLYVDKTTYSSWLNLLRGLIMAKERDSQQWHRPWWRARSGHWSRAMTSKHTPSCSAGSFANSHRARSSSPRRFSAAFPLTYSDSSTLPSVPSVSAHAVSASSGSKRSAEVAFSPVPNVFPLVNPSHQPTGLTLQIPQAKYSGGYSMANSSSPSEPLQSLAQLSLDASPTNGSNSPAWTSGVRQDVGPQILVSAYHLDERQPHTAPQNLYYYALTSSATEERNYRKAKLQYHQPPSVPSSVRHIHAPVPLLVQSVSASPCDGHRRSMPVPVLPPFSEISRNLPQAHTQGREGFEQRQAIPSAPFANAGPPGYHQFYSAHSPNTSALSQQARG
ncbi:cyclin-domain-containing protein [Sparassis latifolia]|uniref:Cyclin-U4-3 n=1 Tax=Sparassis crispa TaxID=139825 RepID=A0A401G8T7_9APHY|nr:Cyclin-U4-3 [Sparassis crispa]GBE78572.1 Cyclin-U4-3 [Sparassis crispa]